jgi:hypothetical protein
MTEWIKHEPGPCPIPNAKAGEWEYKTAVNPTGWKAIADAKNYSTAWHHGTITHYRLIKPAVDWQAIAEQWRGIADEKPYEGNLSVGTSLTPIELAQPCPVDGQSWMEIRAILTMPIGAKNGVVKIDLSTGSARFTPLRTEGKEGVNHG